MSALVGERGLKTSSDFTDFFSALAVDIINGDVDAQDATAACKAGDKIVRMLEHEWQHNNGDPMQISGRKLKTTIPGVTPIAVVS